MLSPRWRKVFNDLWGNKTRTLLVVMSIAVGVFAIGAVASSRVIVLRDMRATYNRITPPSAMLFTPQPFDEELVQSIRRMKEVQDADARAYVNVRVQVAPGQWKTLQLAAIPHYDDIRVNKIFPVNGAWPPAHKELLIERASLPVLRAQVGDTLVVETPSGKQKQLRISGLAHEINVFPVAFSGTPYGYIDLDTLEYLGQPRGLTSLQIAVAERPLDADHIQQVADRVRDRIEGSGRDVGYIWIPPPGKYVPDDAIDAVMLLLTFMGFFSLLLSGFLVINTVAAVLTEQVRQIGIMKAIGARQRQLVVLYLTQVCAYCILALAISIPLGMLGARAFVSFMAGLVNFDVSSWAVPQSVLALELAAGLLVPLVTSLLPVFGGTRVSVRAAISDVGGGTTRQGAIDRALHRVQGLSRPMLLSLRNTFRRKGRLLRTLSTLILAGAIFMSVMSVRDSVNLTVADALKYFNYDIEVQFDRAYRIDTLQQEALRVPGVVEAQSWRIQGGAVKKQNGDVSKDYPIIAIPPGSDFVVPTVVAGRWLLPEDENALVVNTTLQKDEDYIQVGDEITLKVKGRETTWQVVGLVRGAMDMQAFYVNYPHFTRVIHDVGRAGSVYVRTERHDAAYQEQVALNLKAHLDAQGIKVNTTRTLAQIREQIATQFSILVVLLFMMSGLMAIVGGLGLMGSMSISVLERTREIGVMRAIGANNVAILQVIMAEGLVIGLISWLVGALLAVPVSQALSAGIGLTFLKAPLVYMFSFTGTALWLVLVMAIALLASLLPAWRAARLSVREVLAYE